MINRKTLLALACFCAALIGGSTQVSAQTPSATVGTTPVTVEARAKSNTQVFTISNETSVRPHVTEALSSGLASISGTAVASYYAVSNFDGMTAQNTASLDTQVFTTSNETAVHPHAIGDLVKGTVIISASATASYYAVNDTAVAKAESTAPSATAKTVTATGVMVGQ
jgi:hypothetical protein